MIGSVLSYHTNSATCGVAKFSQQLAERLRVPFGGLGALLPSPLLSVKAAELPDWDYYCPHWEPFSLFFHDVPTMRDSPTMQRAQAVYAANAVIAAAIRPYRPDVIEAFCPSTLSGNPTRGVYRVLVFGMAHKLALPHFERLKVQLDTEHPDYTIHLSTAVHEGSPWDVGLTESIDAMRGIFGDHLRVLGFLGDDALAKELQDCDAVAAFFTPALRSNNTSYFAAVEAGKPVHTNRDDQSPREGDTPPTWDKLLGILDAGCVP